MTIPIYHQRVIEQGKKWVNGESTHNSIDDECCPDFSCCEPGLFEQDRAKRVAIYNTWAARRGYAVIIDA